MKIKDIVRVFTHYQDVVITEMHSYTTCHEGDACGPEMTCGRCKGCDGGELPEGIVQTNDLGESVEFKGHACDIPIKLADKTVTLITPRLAKGKRQYLEVQIWSR